MHQRFGLQAGGEDPVVDLIYIMLDNRNAKNHETARISLSKKDTDF